MHPLISFWSRFSVATLKEKSCTYETTLTRNSLDLWSLRIPRRLWQMLFHITHGIKSKSWTAERPTADNRYSRRWLQHHCVSKGWARGCASRLRFHYSARYPIDKTHPQAPSSAGFLERERGELPGARPEHSCKQRLQSAIMGYANATGLPGVSR